jgi:hypothetical protein
MRDYPEIDYRKDFEGNAFHAYIAAYAADVAVNATGYIVIERSDAILRILPDPDGDTDIPIDMDLRGIFMVPAFRSIMAKYPEIRSNRSHFLGVDALTEIDSNDLVTIAIIIADLVKTLGFDYTDIKIRLD